MKRRIPDLLVALVLSVVAYAVGVRVVDDATRAGRAPFFYQEEFAPAVLAACGIGYQNTQAIAVPGLTDFLVQRQDRFDCGALFRQPPPVIPLDSFQGISRYLELSVAGLWRLRGVSWSAVRPLFGLLFGISVGATYGLFRLGASGAVAGLATVLVGFSPLQLSNLPNLRDYAKAPFVLVLLLLCGIMLRRRRTPTTLAVLAIAAGLVAGVGLGFRSDLLLLIPLMLFVAAVAQASGPSSPAARSVRVILFVAAFATIAIPVIRAYGRGSNTAHVALLGLGSPFDEPLRVRAADYDLGYLYNDSYVYTRVRGVADRHGAAGQMPIGTYEYDQASSQYLLVLVRAFPGDVLTRASGALAGVVRIAFEGTPDALSYVRPVFQRFVAYRQQAIRWIVWPAVLLGLAALAFGVAAEPIAAITGLAIFLVLAMAAAIQFHPRHFFYVEPLVWWPSVAALALLPRFRRGFGEVRHDISWTATALVFVGIPVSVIGAIVVARHWQAAHLTGVISRLRSTSGTDLPITATPAGPGVVRVTVPALREGLDEAQKMAHPVTAAHYAFTFGGERCDRVEVAATFRYESTRPYDDFTDTQNLSLGLVGTSLTVYRTEYEGDFPVRGPDGRVIRFYQVRFAGVDLPEGAADCLQRIVRLPDDRWPEIFTDVVDRPVPALYQSLAWEPRPEPLTERLVPVPDTISRRAIAQLLQQPFDARVEFTAPSITRQGAGWQAAGAVEGPYSYVLRLQPQPRLAGALAVVSGELASGGITIGLHQNGGWVSSANVTEPGAFTVVLAVPADGIYQLVVANCLFDGSHRNRFTLARAGWGPP